MPLTKASTFGELSSWEIICFEYAANEKDGSQHCEKKWKMAHLSLLKEKRIPKDLTLQDNSVRLCSSFSHDNILWRRRLEDWCLLFHAMVRKGSYGQLFVQNYVY